MSAEWINCEVERDLWTNSNSITAAIKAVRYSADTDLKWVNVYCQKLFPNSTIGVMGNSTTAAEWKVYKAFIHIKRKRGIK